MITIKPFGVWQKQKKSNGLIAKTEAWVARVIEIYYYCIIATLIEQSP